MGKIITCYFVSYVCAPDATKNVEYHCHSSLCLFVVSDLPFFFFDRVSLTFSIAVTDRKEGYILSWGLKLQSIMAGVLGKRSRVAGHIVHAKGE